MNRTNFLLPIILFFLLFVCSFASEEPAKHPVAADISGQWECIAYIENIDDFRPKQEVQPEMLFLKSIRLQGEGVAVWNVGDKCTYTARWDSEKITSLLERPALYSLKQINEKTYLFVEWISDDVTILNRKPCYYVCAKTEIPNDGDTGPIGRWTTVDFVETIEQFDPAQRHLDRQPFLRGLAFLKDGTAWQIFEENRRKMQWRDNAVDYNSKYPAHFTIKRIGENDYLFIEWISGDVTLRGQKPMYYVLKKAG